MPIALPLRRFVFNHKNDFCFVSWTPVGRQWPPMGPQALGTVLGGSQHAPTMRLYSKIYVVVTHLRVPPFPPKWWRAVLLGASLHTHGDQDDGSYINSF